MKVDSLLSVTCRHCFVQSLGRRGVEERVFVYLLFQLTKNADSYGIVL